MKRIVNVKKFILSTTILFLSIFAIISAIVNTTYSYNETKYKKIYINDGDTLWNIAIAEKEKNEYYKDKDVRYIVQNIKKVNNLSVSNLKVNQELLIPII